MIRSAKNDRENYPRKCVWAQEKETRVKSNPRLSANRPSNNWTQSCCEPLISPLDHLYSPIFHSFCGCPPNFAYPLFFISPGYYSLLKRNWKAYANFFFGGVGGGRGKGGGGQNKVGCSLLLVAYKKTALCPWADLTASVPTLTRLSDRRDVTKIKQAKRK